MKIVQMLPTIVVGDAVSNDALAIGRILKEGGWKTGIYAENIDGRLPKNSASNIDSMPELGPEDVLIYHGSTGTQLNYLFPELGGKKVMVYHNITPPTFFEGYSLQAQKLTEDGYRGMRFLADKVDYCIADSEHNKRDLLAMGFTCPIDVCPIIIPFEDYAKAPSAEVLRRYEGDGWTNLLFVGRIVPNKRQEDVIRAFYCYQRDYNPRSRLFLVGSDGGMERYSADLRAYAELLGVADRVVFPGHIGFDEVLAYYRLADVFVCMSEHEGFCVPLVEAMTFGVPIVARATSAIPETLGEGGLLLENDDPHIAAAAIDRLVTDQELRRSIVSMQKKRLHDFEYDVVKGRFLKCIKEMIDGCVSAAN